MPRPEAARLPTVREAIDRRPRGAAAASRPVRRTGIRSQLDPQQADRLAAALGRADQQLVALHQTLDTLAGTLRRNGPSPGAGSVEARRPS